MAIDVIRSKLPGVWIASFLLLLAVIAIPKECFADTGYYGVVESYGNGEVVIRTTAHSRGTWQIDGATRIAGGIAPGDWVFAEVLTSGHVTTLRFEERPTGHSGVITKINGDVLLVRSGNGTEQWNVVDTTGLSGVERGGLRRGDQIGVKLYKNRNLAELKLINRDVPVTP